MEVHMAKDTKERILAAALEQFSQNGYAGTNIRELTASLGLVKSAMRRHSLREIHLLQHDKRRIQCPRHL